jgi:hypothetical protein
VEIGVVFAKELARVVAGRVDYDKAVVISMLSGVLECCDYVEFPMGEMTVCEFFEKDGVFAHKGTRDKNIFYSSSTRNNINGFCYGISEASLGHRGQRGCFGIGRKK